MVGGGRRWAVGGGRGSEGRGHLSLSSEVERALPALTLALTLALTRTLSPSTRSRSRSPCADQPHPEPISLGPPQVERALPKEHVTALQPSELRALRAALERLPALLGLPASSLRPALLRDQVRVRVRVRVRVTLTLTLTLTSL